jgi:hypothetical protein
MCYTPRRRPDLRLLPFLSSQRLRSIADPDRAPPPPAGLIPPPRSPSLREVFSLSYFICWLSSLTEGRGGGVSPRVHLLTGLRWPLVTAYDCGAPPRDDGVRGGAQEEPGAPSRPCAGAADVPIMVVPQGAVWASAWPAGIRPPPHQQNGLVAGEFQRFHVVVQRFVEDNFYNGPRLPTTSTTNSSSAISCKCLW